MGKINVKISEILIKGENSTILVKVDKKEWSFKPKSQGDQQSHCFTSPIRKQHKTKNMLKHLFTWMEWLKKCNVQLQKLLWWLVFRSLTYKEKKILTNVLKVLIYEIFLKTSYEENKKQLLSWSTWVCSQLRVRHIQVYATNWYTFLKISTHLFAQTCSMSLIMWYGWNHGTG